MRQRLNLAVLCLLSLCAVNHAYAGMPQGQLSFEMTAGYQTASLANFNKNFEKVFEYGYGALVDAEPIPGFILAEAKVRYAVFENLPAFLKLSFTRLEATEILHDEAQNIDAVVSVAALNTVYLGLGIKCAVSISRDLSVFIGADGGCFMPVNSFWDVQGNAASTLVDTDESSPEYNYSQRISFTGLFFGGSAGAGIEWQLSDSWGIIAEGGYKIAKSAITYEKAGIFRDSRFDLTEMDFSGPYFTAGLTMYFGPDSVPTEGNVDEK